MIIKHEAYRQDAISLLLAFKVCMLNNYQFWVDFARDELGRDVTDCDLILVSGRDLTGDWATVAFHEHSANAQVKFQVMASPISAGISALGQWSSSVSVPHRCGPKPTSASAVLFINAENLTTAGKQCIFVRGFKPRRRTPWPLRKLRAAAEPKGFRKAPRYPASDALKARSGGEEYDSEPPTFETSVRGQSHRQNVVTDHADKFISSPNWRSMRSFSTLSSRQVCLTSLIRCKLPLIARHLRQTLQSYMTMISALL